MASNLSEGAVEAIMNNRQTDPVAQNPVLQVVSSMKPIQARNPGNPTRYRCAISDGAYTITAIFATQLNGLIEGGQLTKHSIIRVTNYQANQLSANNKIMVVLGVEHLGNVEGRIGNPQAYTDGGSSSSAGQQQQPQQQQQQQQQAPAPAIVPSVPTVPIQNTSSAMQSQQQRQQAAPGGGAYPPTGASFGSRFGNQDGGFAAQRQAGAAAGAASQPNVYPIKGLNPYQSKWTIRARVSEKSGIKTWRNARGEGTLFSVNLIDESGEIRGTAFRDQVDRLYPQFEVGKVYLISKGAIKMAKSQFSNVQNEYEIAFDYSTDVVPCQDTEAVPTARYSFISLDKLGQLEKNTIVDVLVVAQDVRELTSIVSRTTNNEIQKRDVQVVDESMYQVRLTLWGDDARSFEAYDRPVVAFKGVKVGDFGGRTLSLPGSGSYVLNPDIPEAHRLRGWYDANGAMATYQTYTADMQGGAQGGDMQARQADPSKTVAQVRDEGLGEGDKPDYFSTKATIVYLKPDNLAYPACPNEGCNKKVIEENGQWRCEKCDTVFGEPSYRYIFTVAVGDHTGQMWVQCFNEIGEQIFGRPAREMVALQMADENQFQKVVRDSMFQTYNFRCRARAEVFNDVRRMRYTANRLSSIDYVKEAANLSGLIDAYSN